MTIGLPCIPGEEFEDDGVRWKVLAVDWSDDDKSMVVCYYDVESAVLTEDETEKKRLDGKAEDIDVLEYSSVAEVKAWVQLSS